MGQYAEFRVKNATLCLGYIYFLFFIVFISFFDKASNFSNRILTNQKPE